MNIFEHKSIKTIYINDRNIFPNAKFHFKKTSDIYSSIVDNLPQFALFLYYKVYFEYLCCQRASVATTALTIVLSTSPPHWYQTRIYCSFIGLIKI